MVYYLYFSAMPLLIKKLIAEFSGTFLLVFAGTGAIIINQTTDGMIGNAGIALAFGLAVLIVIEIFGDVSGAHVNPAVTIGFAFANRFSWREVLPYIASQITGAILASFVLKLLFPASQFLGATIPAGSQLQSLILEFLMSAILMFIILSVSSGAKEKGINAAATIGMVVALEAFLGGPVSGASMNPARSIGPALVSENISSLWIYIIAPIIGALCAVPICRATHDATCCANKCARI